MTPKEKAEKLVVKYMCTIRRLDIDNPPPIKMVYGYDIEKQCALDAVDEILKSFDEIFIANVIRSYWKEVKQEIEKL